MKKSIARPLGLATALVLAAALSGCTTTDDTEATGSPSPSVESVEATETVYDECVDGVATILSDGLDGPFELGDCPAVSIVGVEGRITLGAVDRLVVEGDRNAIVVDQVTHVAFGGADNTVEHRGGEPEVVDDGDGNTVTAVE
ncbi:DUF3060 domain-containing protein [Frigoribacterium faeni]|uniref:DUF3060 domain-containing protein n=1 Tax=Frigoribacterium faeni TaxID=145483 RepID=A0A7W3JJS3_9MICO|nr:DUF3060 domain-containing protein [Frigoribacterium faeni]MBA8814081.1 hypothetical protein [Frigoribacterium faeni]BFF16105.1 hypothetical protein GCM10025699_74080 [Microbacterium flavescens]GEK82673.1 hypothetical protein FFA01_09820 [Frigoribacterium faeni]